MVDLQKNRVQMSSILLTFAKKA